MEDYGALTPLVTWVGQILAAIIAIMMLIAGKRMWAPVVPGLAIFAVRLTALVAGVSIVYLWLESQKTPVTMDFISTAITALYYAVPAAIVYAYLRLVYTFECEGDTELYTKGFRLREQARFVLNGDFQKVKADEFKHINKVPPNAREFFCKSGKMPELIWEVWSYALVIILLVISYAVAMVPLVIAISSSAIALGTAMES